MTFVELLKNWNIDAASIVLASKNKGRCFSKENSPSFQVQPEDWRTRAGSSLSSISNFYPLTITDGELVQ
jgi:hypothetical protein